MPTTKHSVGLQFANMSPDAFQKAEVEVGLPLTSSSSGFAKADFFVARRFELSPKVCHLAWQVQGGVLRPLSGQTAINDRFFISSPLGYSHLGHAYESNLPEQA